MQPLQQFYQSPLHKYYVFPRVEAFIDVLPMEPSPNPLPVVVLGEHTMILETNIVVMEWLEKDDVFGSDFMTNIVIVPRILEPTEQHNIHWYFPPDLNTSAGRWNPCKFIPVILPKNAILPNGPYFLVGQELHQAWRLYPDNHDAFIITVVPQVSDTSTSFKVLDSISDDGLWRNVAVPSRLYSKATHEKPLAGKRISVKDNFQLAGIKTTQMNRNYINTYDVEEETASYVEKLLDLGAVIVGKTKMNAFAGGEEPTDQWIDFHAPFNPRGDGYLSPLGSTSGGAAALAAYEWLDYSVGTDTTKSIRGSAASNGLHGLRTSTGDYDMKGIHVACEKLDSIGLLARDIDSMLALARNSARIQLRQPQKFPTKILYCTDFFPHTNPDQQMFVDAYIGILEEFLKVKRTEMSIAELWSKTAPEREQGLPITQLFQTTLPSFYWDGYHVWDKFRQDHYVQCGRNAYKGTHTRWKRITQEKFDQASDTVDVYSTWFEKHILSEDDETGSTAILVLPSGSGSPRYRDVANEAPSPMPATRISYLVSMLGLPQLVTPIGQIPYGSKVTGRKEYLPVVGTIVGAKGSELMLIDLVKRALERANCPTSVMTGPLALPLKISDENVAPGLLFGETVAPFGSTSQQHLGTGQDSRSLAENILLQKWTELFLASV